MAEVDEIVTLSVGDADAVPFPDSISLTTAECQETGENFITTGADGSQVVIENYYTGDTPPELKTTDGAKVSGEMVI